MACFKLSPTSPFGSARLSGSYATEADCNQACREGACCEGTTCSVKPQCQCVCQSGSCCGPDTFTNSNGETGPRCRNESQSACTARGGVWRCGVSCIGLAGDQFAGQPLGSGICTSLTSLTPSPVFKGVGTTCATNPCDPCVVACSPNPTHPISLAMTISNFSGPQASRFQINTTRQISRSLFFIGTETCWAYNFNDLLDIGDQCPTPPGQQRIDGLSLNVVFSLNEARFFANYKDASGQCHRYDISWPLVSASSARPRLCEQGFPFSGTVSQQGVSFNYSITSNPLP